MFHERGIQHVNSCSTHLPKTNGCRHTLIVQMNLQMTLQMTFCKQTEASAKFRKVF